tara:strand:- start:13324 stop:14364 length:1041 start_codon:yes stop_codon:yes gene_type:complete
LIVQKYLSKQVKKTSISIIIILLFIVTSNQYISLLSKAVHGKIVKEGILDILFLSMPTLLGVLLPIALFLGIILVLSRLYADSEMVILNSNGIGPLDILNYIKWPILSFALIAAVVNLYVNPKVMYYKDFFKNKYQAIAKLQHLPVGEFLSFANGKYVIYISNKVNDDKELENIFLAEDNADSLILSQKASFVKGDNNERILVLHDGMRYHGISDKKSLNVIEFKKHGFMLPKINISNKLDKKEKPTKLLFNSQLLEDKLELQWRISFVLAPLILAILAIPLSRVSPRQGKFTKIIPAILIFISYYNLLASSIDWVEAGYIPLWIGLWWVHLLFLTAAIWLWRKKL